MSASASTTLLWAWYANPVHPEILDHRSLIQLTGGYVALYHAVSSVSNLANLWIKAFHLQPIDCGSTF